MDELLKVTGYLTKEMNQNALYEKLKEKIKDNGYPSISKAEAKARIGTAVKYYRSGKMKTVPYSEGMDEIDNWLNKL
jgi:hypothetical protein